MLHKAWNSKGEMPYCFPRSSIKVQGHTGQNITDFDPNWAFPDYRPVAAFKSLRFALLFTSRWFIINAVVSLCQFLIGTHCYHQRIGKLGRSSCLTFMMLKPECSWQARSIQWLLVLWLSASPGHQQPLYWLCGINGSFSSTRKDFNLVDHLSFEKW